VFNIAVRGVRGEVLSLDLAIRKVLPTKTIWVIRAEKRRTVEKKKGSSLEGQSVGGGRRSENSWSEECAFCSSDQPSAGQSGPRAERYRNRGRGKTTFPRGTLGERGQSTEAESALVVVKKTAQASDRKRE